MIKTICCFNQNALKFGCTCFRNLFNFTINHQIKLAYFSFVLIITLIIQIIKKIMPNPTEYMISITGCTDAGDAIKNCVFYGVVLRIYASLTFLFFLQFLAMNFKNNKVKIINEGIWFIKIFMFCAIFGFTLLFGPKLINFFERSLFLTWQLFYILQILVIIDLMYTVGIFIKEKVQQTGSKIFRFISVFFTIIFYTLAIIINYYTYKNHSIPQSICLINSCGIGIFFLVALVQINPNNTFLLSGIFLTFVNIQTYMLGQNMKQFDKGQISLGCQLVMFFLLGITFIGMLSKGSGKIKTPKSSLNQKFHLTTRHQQQQAGYLTTSKWRYFHIVMMIICMSIPIIITQWGRIYSFEYGNLTKIECIFSIYISYVVYFWTIICIKCIPDKDLSELQSYFKEFELN